MIQIATRTSLLPNTITPSKLQHKGVLDACAQFANESLSNLYGANMPPALVKAHCELDKAVDAAYLKEGGAKRYENDAQRVAFLFTRYQALTSLI